MRIIENITCSSPDRAAELGADTVLDPLDESGRAGGEPGGCGTDTPLTPGGTLTGVPSPSRFRKMEGRGDPDSQRMNY